MVTGINIAGRAVGLRHPCYIIAEAGVNHNGNLNMAYQLVDIAASAGADAVKFQTFKAERLVTNNAPKAGYQRQNTDASESSLEMLRRLELGQDAHRDLMAYCRQKEITFLSTPFDEESADFLADSDMAAFKIPSGEITNLPFLAHVARKGKPLLVSTGMSYLGEVEIAVRTIEEAGNSELILLHCVSNYPANPASANLRVLDTMAKAFGVPVGYSDHTTSNEVPIAAVALGACVIEKHFTLDHHLPGPDHRASLEPDELAALVKSIRTIEAALGCGRKEPAAGEAETAAVARRSIVTARDLPAGTTLTKEMIALRRPGTGLPPAMHPYLIGRTVRIHLPAGTLISLEMLA
ncbi:MAG: N-acetylneuraminate synthase [Candidatus Omnitrophica bacterium]|nr:N-acetylneuraminate synthase [Candidatus Omnitrophota bacterium]